MRAGLRFPSRSEALSVAQDDEVAGSLREEALCDRVIMELAVKRLNKSILGGFAGLDEVQFDSSAL